jgi:hypothetical protein
MQVVNGSLVGVLVPVAASAIILAMVAVAGGRFGGGGAPFPDADDGAAVTCVDEAVWPVGRAPIKGRARLCFSRVGIQSTVDLEHLPNEVAHTAWLAYFGQPAGCSTSPCGGSDPSRTDAGIVERIDAALPDLAGRVSLTRAFREIHPHPGSEVQILIFQRGVLSQVLPSDRVRLLVEWPLAPASQVMAAGKNRPIAEPLIGRAIMRLLEGLASSDRGRRLIGS